MNNQITNPTVPTPKGLLMNEKDGMMNILSKEKAMVKDYVVALTEASNSYLFDRLKPSFEKILELQRKAYLVMFRCGWYPMECADSQKIQQKINKLTQELTDLNEPSA